MDALEKAAKRVRNKCNLSSEDVLAAFRSFYSPCSVKHAHINPQGIPDTVAVLIDAYVKALKSRHFPDKNASKEEKEEYALCNMALTDTLRAISIRLEQLTRMKKFAEYHPRAGIIHLGIPRYLNWVNDDELEEFTFSFAQCVSGLQGLGIRGMPPQNDSGSTVRDILVNP